ncbi:hypothetical protein WMY93_014223 [Mugilogobius chulae]|uniref:Transposase n=1 Tax=Mugilogobius chulae TaxID=88201 RepID=A0AAW0NUZ5_9GOBI
MRVEEERRFPKILACVPELTGATFKRRLKPDAVPTIFPPKELKRPRKTSEDRVEKRDAKEEALEEEDGDMMVQDTDTGATRQPTASVGVQCSPQMVDSYTQTPQMLDSSTQTDPPQTSEAAVQWQAADVFSSRDHIYSLNPELDRHSVATSQELFTSQGNTSEMSYSQCSHSDPDFNVSSEHSESMQESQTTTTAATHSRVFLVFEEQLKELLELCLKCGGLIVQEDTRELENEGSQLTLQLTCANNCTYRWQSQPRHSGTKGTGNLLLSASVFFSGIQFERICSNMNLKSISEDTYISLRKRFVFPVVQNTWINEQRAVLATMKSQEVVLCGNGRCDSPGHSAKYCTYTFLDTKSNKVADFKVVSVPQVSNSNAMELQGFKDALRTIEENEIRVSTISTDRHPQIVKEMRVNHADKVHQFDPWHVAKGVSKKLTAEAKRKVCEELGAWIPSIINHLWWSAQTCGGDAVLLKEKWVSVIHHVTNRHDWPGNRQYHQCVPPLDEASQRTKLWMKPGSEAHNALVKVVTNKRLLTWRYVQDMSLPRVLTQSEGPEKRMRDTRVNSTDELKVTLYSTLGFRSN